MKVVKTANSHDELMNGALELMCQELSRRVFFDSAMKEVSGDLKKLTNERARIKGNTLDLPNGWKEKLERSNRSIGIQEQSLNGWKQKNVKKKKRTDSPSRYPIRFSPRKKVRVYIHRKAGSKCSPPPP